MLGGAVSAPVLGGGIGGFGGGRLLAHLGRLLVPAVVAGACGYGILVALDGSLGGLSDKLADLVILAVGGITGVIAFIGLAYLLRIGEVREAINLVVRRVRPRKVRVRA